MPWTFEEYYEDDPLHVLDGRLTEPVLRRMADALEREGAITAADLHEASGISSAGIFYARDVPNFRDEVLPILSGETAGGVTVDRDAAEAAGLVTVTRYEDRERVRVNSTDALREAIVELIDPTWGTRGSRDVLTPIARGAEALYTTLASPSTPRLDPEELWHDHTRYTGQRAFNARRREQVIDGVVAELPGYSSAPLEFRLLDRAGATAVDGEEGEAPA